MLNVDADTDRDYLPPEEILFGASAVMTELRGKLEKVASTSLPVLIQGANGTGKELLARWIHKRSASTRPFLRLGCGPVPGSRLETLLRGYQETPRDSNDEKRAELINGGTLFFDEIQELDRKTQSQLLRYFQDEKSLAMSGQDVRSSVTRLVSSTSSDMEREVAAGRFRSDLFFCFTGVLLKTPRLAERREDIPALAEYFWREFQLRYGKDVPPLPAAVLDQYRTHSWPGNIRELANQVARYVILGTCDAQFVKKAVPSRGGVVGVQTGMSLKRVSKQAVRELERRVILEVLRANQWSRKRTADVLKISYRALIYKIREAGVPSKRSQGRDVADGEPPSS